MARRRQKKRTHEKESEETFKSIPRSMVIHLGTALENHTLTQLVKDTRNMMQPHTAISLRERKSNKLKDFVVMAGPLGVSYLMLFSQNEDTGSTHLRMSSMPHGPTISFKILEYSLQKDINRFMKSPKSLSKSAPEYASPPLLVMNGFNNPKDAEPQEKLVITAFQNMFPPINPTETKVNTIKRVLLLNKDKETGIIDLRHYIIDTRLVDVNKGVKKLVQVRKHLNKRLPNLAKVQDVADIILDNGMQGTFTSDSEVEDDAVVEVDEELVTKPKLATGNGVESVKRKKAIKLTEVGPRMKLDLVKIEQGVCAGKVLYHSQFTKSEREKNMMEQRHAVRKKQKEARRKEQKARVDEKNEKKRLKKERRKERQARGEEVSDEDEGEDSEREEDSNDDDDDAMSDVPSDYSLDDGADNEEDKLFEE